MGAISKNQFSAKSRLAPIDFLRGLALVAVFLFHAVSRLAYVTKDPGSQLIYDWAGPIGSWGTDLFLILSGCLVHHAFVSRPPTNLFAFTKRRLSKIYPPYLIVLGVYVLIGWLEPGLSKLPGDAWSSASVLMRNLLLVPGIFPQFSIMSSAWTMALLSGFYVVYPYLFTLGKRYRFSPSWMSSTSKYALAIALTISLAYIAGKQQLYLGRFGGLVVGIILAMLLEKNSALEHFTEDGLPVDERLSSWTPVTLGTFLLLSRYIAAINTASVSAIFGDFGSFALNVAMQLGGLACLAYGLLRPRWSVPVDPAPLRGFFTRNLIQIGSQSFSFYLVQGLVLNLYGLLAHKLKMDYLLTPSWLAFTLVSLFIMNRAAGALLEAILAFPHKLDLAHWNLANLQFRYLWPGAKSKDHEELGTRTMETENASESTVSPALR